MNSYESAVGQLISRRLQDLIIEKTEHLVEGKFINQSDLAATGSQYIRINESIRTLRTVLDICKEVEADLRKG
jgi:hypothetical protein